MSEYVTQKQLDKTLDRHQTVILEAVNVGFQDAKADREMIRREMEQRFILMEAENNKRFDKIESSINHLTNTLDAFLKRLTDHEDEFVILKAEVAQMKSVFREKFDVDISLQGK